jgi:peptide/nickel transport system substrate-binding protein
MFMTRIPLMIVAVVLALAVACGGDSGGSAPSAQQQGGTAPGSPATGATPAQPKGELRIASPFLSPNLDVTKGTTGFNLLSYGAAETLTRLTPEFKVEPWLAQSVTAVDPLTWRVTLRPNATFHDGSPVTAEDVAASFRHSWDTLPAANSFISKDTAVTVVDATTLEFKTPQPNGAFLNNLASFQFVVHKPGTDASILTGPYRPARLTVDNDLILEAYTGHWAGPPPIARIQIRQVADANARVLALQAGDVDLITGVPAEQVKHLPSGVEGVAVPSTRVQYTVFNHTRPPFNDRAVREAFSLGVDRNVLNQIGFDGQSAAMSGIFRQGVGQEVVAAQGTDVNRAKSVLDAAGWSVGSDGVRVKDGRRLTLTLISYPQRADLTPMATSIQAQLKPLGFDIQFQQVQDITKALEGSDWDAAMYSVNLLPTGDPLYAFNQTLVAGGDWNYGKYTSAQMNATIERMRGEIDPARRQALSREAQEIIKTDTPNAYLVASPLIFAYKKEKVLNFTPHPSDTYLIDNRIAVR